MITCLVLNFAILDDKATDTDTVQKHTKEIYSFSVLSCDLYCASKISSKDEQREVVMKFLHLKILETRQT